uniref:Uncharacterized protein K04H4.2-like n=1 Tax=Crassostrea virginica TaxID=6565 RepID=A0A8B8DGP5_CRAVI|nr:uncharacterized protein K04H4.2-like [Crassostrea virginica]
MFLQFGVLLLWTFYVQGQVLDRCIFMYCGPGYTCYRGECIPLGDSATTPPTKTCNRYIACPEGYRCVNSQCVPKGNSEPVETCNPYLRPFCRPGYRCVNFKCVKIGGNTQEPYQCVDYQDCPRYHHCVRGRCKRILWP